MFYTVVRSILPRVHWSEEELAEGAFAVGVPNATMPHYQPASNISKLVVDGVNKTITAVVGVLGNITKEVARDLLHPSPRNVTFPSGYGENGGHMVQPHSGVQDPATPPTTPSEVMSVLKVVFVL